MNTFYEDRENTAKQNAKTTKSLVRIGCLAMVGYFIIRGLIVVAIIWVIGHFISKYW